MSVVDLQSWAAFAAILGALLANFAMMSRKIDSLDQKIDRIDAKFESKFDGLDAKFDAKFDGLDAKFDAKFDGLDAKFESKIDGLRTELRQEMHDGFSRMDDRLNVIEQRTYDLSTRLPPAPAAQHG